MLAWCSLGALVIVMLVSCTTQLNVGVLAIAFAWVVGVFIAGLTPREVLAAFPYDLFIILAGVTLLFTQAQLNGTLDRVAHHAVKLCRGNKGLMPVTFFVLGAVIASAGPGNISTAAMLGPMAMTVASRASIPPFLMAIMVGNGAQAGALSPVAPTGLIVAKLMAEKVGLPGNELQTYLANLVAHAIVAFGGYLLFGGWKLFRSSFTGDAAEGGQVRFERTHWITLGVIAVVLVPVLTLKAHIGLASFAGASVLAALRVADHEQAIRRMPWTPIIMVCGVSVLVGLLEKTGGLDLFSSTARALRHREHADRLRCAGHRRHLCLQQHVERRAAGVPAHCAQARHAGGWRPAERGDLDECRRAPRRHVAAFDDGRRLYRRDRRSRAGPADLQQAAGLGPVDDDRRNDRLLSVLSCVLRYGDGPCPRGTSCPAGHTSRDQAD